MKLRPMAMDDAYFMLELKNYPETRRFSIVSHDEIKPEEHYQWLEKNIQYFQVITDNDKKIGAIRIKDYEISIWVDREFWKKGIATYILQYVSKKGMTCKIVNGNVGSFKAFVRAGFEPIGYTDNYYTLKKW
jgi:RimJ/RimL family protein N-acetyltransferase